MDATEAEEEGLLAPEFQRVDLKFCPQHEQHEALAGCTSVQLKHALVDTSALLLLLLLLLPDEMGVMLLRPLPLPLLELSPSPPFNNLLFVEPPDLVAAFFILLELSTFAEPLCLFDEPAAFDAMLMLLEEAFREAGCSDARPFCPELQRFTTSTKLARERSLACVCSMYSASEGLLPATRVAPTETAAAEMTAAEVAATEVVATEKTAVEVVAAEAVAVEAAEAEAAAAEAAAAEAVAVEAVAASVAAFTRRSSGCRGDPAC